MARGVEWGDHSNDRDDAHTKVGKTIRALMSGDYYEARDQIELALAIDREFAEAHLTRAMVYLAIGDSVESERSATQALTLFDRGKVDESAWPDGPLHKSRSRGMLVAVRLQCVARVAQRSQPSAVQSGRLFELVYEFSAAKDCEEMKQVLERWNEESKVVAIVTQSRLDCPTLWNCPPSAAAKKTTE
jgi:tetratricopeptide (TPR) repeat protein